MPELEETKEYYGNKREDLEDVRFCERKSVEDFFEHGGGLYAYVLLFLP